MSEELVKRVFKDNLKRERQERGWSQKTLAGKAGLSLQTVQYMEQNGTFTAMTLAAVCKGFDLDPWVLLIEEGK